MKICSLNVNNCCTTPKQNLGSCEKPVVPILNENSTMMAPTGYHRALFETSQNAPKINFTADFRADRLKGTLTKVCEEAIEKYNKHDALVEQNMFTNAYLKHCFNFKPQEGNNWANLSDPFDRQVWNSYSHYAQGVIDSGQKPVNDYTRKLKSGIASWSENFLQGITREQNEGKNNLLRELLETGGDIGQVKSRLGIVDSHPANIKHSA